jgi:hypothetical protein
VFILSLSGAVSREGLLLEFEWFGLDVAFPEFGLAEFPSRTGLVTLFACDGRVPG